MSDYIVIYKSIKNAYARINKDGILQLSVPKSRQHKPELIVNLVSRAKHLEDRHAQTRSPSQATEEGTMLFGEWVTWDELGCSVETTFPQLASELYEYAKPILDDYAARIGKSYHSLSIKKSKTKRGSCSYDQRLVLNRELVHLPTRLIVYVIIHEACHLKVKNHSDRFRELVAIHCPNYKMLRKELRMYILK